MNFEPKIHNIHLAKLNHPREISHRMQDHEIKYYVYVWSFLVKFLGKSFLVNFPINIGKSTDKEWEGRNTGGSTWGNRVYRKACAFDGWGDKVNIEGDTSVKDFRRLLDEKTPWLSKEDMILTIYDYTKELEGQNEDQISKAILNKEHDLMQEFKQEFGSLPLLNKRETHAIHSCEQKFNELFDSPPTQSIIALKL